MDANIWLMNFSFIFLCLYEGKSSFVSEKATEINVDKNEILFSA